MWVAFKVGKMVFGSRLDEKVSIVGDRVKGDLFKYKLENGQPYSENWEREYVDAFYDRVYIHEYAEDSAKQIHELLIENCEKLCNVKDFEIGELIEGSYSGNMIWKCKDRIIFFSKSGDYVDQCPVHKLPNWKVIIKGRMDFPNYN